jgi:hypothetical protein
VLETQNDEMMGKMNDFNIFEVFKGGKQGEVGGDSSMAFISMLEKKTFKKFEMTDDKFKKGEEETYKLKNEILNLKAFIDTVNKNLNSVKEDLTSNINKVTSDIKANMNINEKAIKEELDDKFKYLTNYVDIKVADMNSIIQLPEEKEVLSNPILTIETDKKVDDPKLLKKIADLERNFRIFNTTINIEQINKDINRINNHLNDKVSKSEFFEIKEFFSN